MGLKIAKNNAMKAFWWFENNKIAGLARPGFNAHHWFDMPFDEGLAHGWLGQFPCGEADIKSFKQHLNTYAPRVFKFYNLDEKTGAEALKKFETPEGFKSTLDKLNKRTGFYESIELDGDRVVFAASKTRLQSEIEELKNRNISTIVSLTEHHHKKDELSQHFETHHISIQDLGAPEFEQSKQMAEILKNHSGNGAIAVHCLAGIGRTSTMIITAKMILGESLESLKSKIAIANPSYIFTGRQGEYIDYVEQKLKSKKIQN